MKRRFWTDKIAIMTMITTVALTTGCGGITTLPPDSTQPVVDQTEATIDRTEDVDEGLDQTDSLKLQGTTVTQEGPYGSITLTIPKGWEYRLCPVGDDALLSSSYGIQFYPKGQKGYVEVGY